MCDYEEFHYTCKHILQQLLSYCHFARCDPYHQCFGVRAVKQRWSQPFPCKDCQDAAMRARR